MMSLRTGPLYGLGMLLFSRRDSLLLLVPTRVASSSSENPALLRKLVRNSPNGCIVEHSHFVLKSHLRYCAISQFSRNVICVPNFLRYITHMNEKNVYMACLLGMKLHSCSCVSITCVLVCYKKS